MFKNHFCLSTQIWSVISLQMRSLMAHQHLWTPSTSGMLFVLRLRPYFLNGWQMDGVHFALTSCLWLFKNAFMDIASEGSWLLLFHAHAFCRDTKKVANCSPISVLTVFNEGSLSRSRWYLHARQSYGCEVNAVAIEKMKARAGVRPGIDSCRNAACPQKKASEAFKLCLRNGM